MNSVIYISRALQAAALMALALVFSSPLQQPVQANEMGGKVESGIGPNRDQHHQMMAEHGQMIADMKAADAAIAELTTKLKTVPQTGKIDLLADIVTRLAAQQTKLHEGIGQMHQAMMSQGSSMMDTGGMCPCMTKENNDGKTAEQSMNQK